MSDIFGKIEAPVGVAQYNTASGGDIGIILFASRMLQLVTVGAGVYVLINIVLAGISLISGSGKSDSYSKAINQIIQSVIGIGVIVASYTIAALIGLLLFGDPLYILNPKICGPNGGPGC